VNNTNKRLYKSHGQGVAAAAILVVALSILQLQYTQQETQHENILSLIRLNLIYCELIFIFLFLFLKERSFISLFDLVWIFVVHLYRYYVVILRRYSFNPLWDYCTIVLFLSLVLRNRSTSFITEVGFVLVFQYLT